MYKSRTHHEGESFEQFVMELKLLIKDCAYTADMQDDQIPDHIVFGIRSNQIRQKLIREGSELTLERCMEIARTHELSQAQCKAMDEPSVVYAVKQPKGAPHRHARGSKRSKPANQLNPKKQQHENCNNCGLNPVNNKYLTNGETCHYCAKLNHFAKMCRKKVIIDVVDIDPEIVTIATEWFGFTPDKTLKAVVDDGLQFVRKEKEKGSRRHVIMLDVDSKDRTVGMSCPPQPFVETSYLQCIKDCLHPGGVFVLNLVCRDETLKQEVLNRIKDIFTKVYIHDIEDEVNEVVYALNVDSTVNRADFMKILGDNSRHLMKCVEKGSNTGDVDLVQAIENMKIL